MIGSVAARARSTGGRGAVGSAPESTAASRATIGSPTTSWPGEVDVCSAGSSGIAAPSSATGAGVASAWRSTLVAGNECSTGGCGAFVTAAAGAASTGDGLEAGAAGVDRAMTRCRVGSGRAVIDAGAGRAGDGLLARSTGTATDVPRAGGPESEEVAVVVVGLGADGPGSDSGSASGHPSLVPAASL